MERTWKVRMLVRMIGTTGARSLMAILGLAAGVLGVLMLAEIVGWTIRYQHIGPLFDWLTHTVTALGRAGERSTASLERLKSARDRLRESETGSQSKGDVRPVDRKTRFDAGEPSRTVQSRPISESLGGAESGLQKPSHDAAGTSDQETESKGDMTSRLLRAKRRAQRDMDDKKDD